MTELTPQDPINFDDLTDQHPKSGIYCIRNLINGKMYIGSTVSFIHRKSAHLSSLRREQHSSPYLQYAWAKYGPESFVFEVLQFIPCDDIQEIFPYEQYWLDLHRTYDGRIGYNIAHKAHSGMAGRKHSDATKQLMHEQRAGRTLSEYQCQRISEGLVGKPKSEEHCKKLSAVRRNSEAAKQQIRNLVESNTGRKLSPEHVQKIIDMNTGSKRTEETKDSMRKAWERRKSVPGYVNHMKGVPKSDYTKQMIREAGVVTRELKRQAEEYKNYSIYEGGSFL